MKIFAANNCNSAPDGVSTALKIQTMGSTLPSLEKNLGLDDLQRVCARFAERLQPGDAILLHGPLAAGKTQFVKCLTQALGTEDPVTSPTFGLANFYSTSAVPVLHIDTYRLEDQAEFRQLGLDEYYDSHLTLVEWGEKVRSDFEDALDVSLDFGVEGERVVTFSWQGSRWVGLVEHALEMEA
ncbi:MAG: tRNA (adenosine(37)-N6)-threonylcarbamoyltransferase complex ATPase subunit type 1 TsaE [Rhizobiaceae bacterium]